MTRERYKKTIMAEDIFFKDVVTAETFSQANQLLDFLSKKVEPDWQNVLNATLTPAELTMNIKNVNAAIGNTADGASPVGAIAGGTGQIKADAGLSGEDSQRAIRLLKQSGRLVQAGKGRGKALVLLSANPLDPAEFAGLQAPMSAGSAPSAELAPEGFVPANNVSGLLRAIRDVYRKQQEEFNALLITSTKLEKALQTANNEVRELRARVLALNEELESTRTNVAATTWS